MKNIILASSALCVIAMILFINMGMKKINQSQEDSMEPVKDWFDEITERQEDLAAAKAAKEAAKLQFSRRMKELSLKQESISTNLVNEFTSSSEKSPAEDPDGATLLQTLIRKQTEIINEFNRLRIDLTEHLQGKADSKHRDVLDSIVSTRAINHLKDIKSKLLSNQSMKAAESSKVWAEKMAEWATQLESQQ